jgi:amino acid adenylation domain-containing protein
MATRTQKSFERTVGYFVNPVVLRSQLSAELSIRETIRQARGTLLAALDHQDFPFALLVERLHPHRDSSRSPIFQVMLDWHKVERAADQPAWLDVGKLEAETIEQPQQEGVFDLYLEISETAGSLAGTLKYDTALFRPQTISRMAAHLQSVLESIAEDPEQSLGSLPLLTADERRQITVDWNRTRSDYPRSLQVGELIGRQAGETPNAIAAVFEEQELSYRDLNRQANRLAHHLRQCGAGPGARVGLCLDRSLEMLVALLGILKSGAAYVPLDPGYPATRISYMLHDAEVTVLVTSDDVMEELAYDARVVNPDADRAEIERQSDQEPERLGSAEDLAYIIYTSGSTGKPKGVGVRHRNVVNFLEAMRRRPGLTAADTLLAVTTISFDIHVLELFLPLLVGARVEVASREVAADGRRLLELLQNSGATVMQATPTTWQMLLAAGWEERFDLKALCGGEALSPTLARDLRQRTTAVWNMYGPTETTVWSSVSEVGTAEDGITVGSPIANTQLYILDDRLQPLPIGATGELYIGGEGVTPGYIQLPEQTAARFLQDPFADNPEARLYRTGDLARYRDNGEVEVLGRVDHQVKLRGFRVELGEVESSLCAHEAVREALVTVREDNPSAPALVAYLIPDGPADPTSSTVLMGFLKNSLPQYMVPAHYVWLDHFPLAPNGKIDRNALPKPDLTSRTSPRRPEPQVSGTEAMLMEIWREVLGLAEIDVYDTFFDLGGHSLLSLQVVDRFEKATGVRLNPTELVNQTVRQIAARHEELAKRQSAGPGARLPAKILGALKNGFFGTGSET